ncbi:hypothetical protein EGW08_011424 [Elysia chlorotica]|uniref:J domain-containing protein n=1 Tax=Elysia chlorotica TaxID=188477 RepID=A0A433TGX3_ELYCH|nr:hypothetical protein EGW08_011424 [Elysia chlorotica]
MTISVAKEIKRINKFWRTVSFNAPFKNASIRTSFDKVDLSTIKLKYKLGCTCSNSVPSSRLSSGYGFSCSKPLLYQHAMCIGRIRVKASISEARALNITFNRLASTFVKNATHYEVLNISRSASTDEVRQAFISLSKKWHPDKNPKDPTRHQKFVQINEAYSTLSKPLARRDYDLTLDAQKYVSRQMNASTSHTYGYGYSPHAGPYYHHREHVYDEYYWAGEAHGTQRARFTSLMNFYMLIVCATFATVSIILHYMYRLPDPKHHHLRKNLSLEEVEKHDLIMQSEQDGVTLYYYSIPKKDSKKFDIVVLRKSLDSTSEEPKMQEVTRSPK